MITYLWKNALFFLILQFFEIFKGISSFIYFSYPYCSSITKTHLFKYIEIFTSKNWKISGKKDPDIFHISAQNIDCGYPLEPPRWGGSNEYSQSMLLSRNKKNNVYPVNPSFTI